MVASIPISSLSHNQALLALDRMVQYESGCYVVFCEANLLARASRDPALMKTIQDARMALADGVAVRLYAQLIGLRVPERTPGPSFLLRACEFGLSRGYRHFFYGGAEGVPQRLAERLRQRYPGIQIVGAYSPPFRELTEAEEAEVKEMIEAARPHLLWVGLGGPKQNLWMASHVGKIGVPVMLGVGAAFDFHSGNRLWAPAWIRKCGLEWLFRTFTGGRATFRRNIWCLSVVSCLLAKACIQKYVSPRFALKVR